MNGDPRVTDRDTCHGPRTINKLFMTKLSFFCPRRHPSLSLSLSVLIHFLNTSIIV